MFGDIRTLIFLLLGFGFAVADAWYFHRFDPETDLTIALGILGAAGISVGHSAGVAAALAQPPAAPTVVTTNYPGTTPQFDLTDTRHGA